MSANSVSGAITSDFVRHWVDLDPSLFATHMLRLHPVWSSFNNEVELLLRDRVHQILAATWWALSIMGQALI